MTGLRANAAQVGDADAPDRSAAFFYIVLTYFTKLTPEFNRLPPRVGKGEKLRAGKTPEETETPDAPRGGGAARRERTGTHGTCLDAPEAIETRRRNARASESGSRPAPFRFSFRLPPRRPSPPLPLRGNKKTLRVNGGFCFEKGGRRGDFSGRYAGARLTSRGRRRRSRCGSACYAGRRRGARSAAP